MSLGAYATDILSGVALITGAAVYGAELFAAIVLRSALYHLDPRELTRTMGFVHRYGDRRMPVFFAVSLIAAALAAGAAAWADRAMAATVMGVTVVARLAWMVIYLRVSAPINRELTAAALTGSSLAHAQVLQRRWDRVIPIRLSLQFIATVGACVALALP